MRDVSPDDKAWPFSPEIISVRIAEAVRMTGFSRNKICECIAFGDIEIAKIGRSTVVLVASLRASSCRVDGCRAKRDRRSIFA